VGADIKSLRTRIKSVDSTLHLTSAMGLVASSKIRRANDSMVKSREYKNTLDSIVKVLSASKECQKSPYLKSGEGKRKIIVIAGDRGLAGGYNSNIFRLMREYGDCAVVPIGKRACEKFGKAVVSSESFSSADAVKLANELCAEYLEGKISELDIVGTEYVSMMTQNAHIKKLLPIEGDGQKSESPIFEPDEMTILSIAVPEYVAGCIMAEIKESFASEVAARRMAMDSAGKNAKKMIDELQIKYNRARQGAITQEITEIVAGSGE